MGRLRGWVGCGLAALALPGLTWDFSAMVVDGAGAPLADAVVVLEAAGASPPPPDRPARAAIGQQDKLFVPRVLAVRTGTVVSFPNRDPILHHVYSFSPAKPFELELYGAGEVPELTFDQPGIVAIACNIHDSMRGHVFVTDSPWFAVSGVDGAVTITGVSAPAVTVQVWHERQQAAVSPLPDVGTKTPPPRFVIDVRAGPAAAPLPHEAGDY
jgi:plastocyanin